MPFQKGTIRKEVGFSKEEWEMWQSAITIHYENGTPLFIPDFIDVYELEEGEEIEYEEE